MIVRDAADAVREGGTVRKIFESLDEAKQRPARYQSLLFTVKAAATTVFAEQDKHLKSECICRMA